MSEKKEKYFKVYCTSEEYKEVKLNALKAEVSLSDYFMRLHKSKPFIIKERNETIQKIHDIRGVANNLNQISKHLNSGNSATQKVLEDITDLKNRIDLILNNLE